MAKIEAICFIPNYDRKTNTIIFNGKPLVVCKDCKHFDEYNVECIEGHNPNPLYNFWFCADGERKEGR